MNPRACSHVVDSARIRRPVGVLPVERLEDRRMFSASVVQGLDAIPQYSTQLVAPTSSSGIAAAVGNPSVRQTSPANGSTGIAPAGDVIVYVNLPNHAGVTNDPALLS